MLTCHPQFPQSWTIYLLWPLSILMIVDCSVNSHQGFSSYQIWSFFLCRATNISQAICPTSNGTAPLKLYISERRVSLASYQLQLETSIPWMNWTSGAAISLGFFHFHLVTLAILRFLILQTTVLEARSLLHWKTFPNWLTWHFVTTISVAVTFLGLVSWTNSSIWSFATSI